MDKFCGYYNMISSENFDEYMKKLGVGFALRMIGSKTKPSLEIVNNGEDFSIKTYSTFKNTELKFKLGESVDETTIDGRPMKTTFTLEGEKLVQKQVPVKEGDKHSVITREIVGENLVTVSLGSFSILHTTFA
uniref:Cytosolic fatty-acid binding proteins domain-containing protein n=1 Tax=Romanomermis culicivorax TaxID=13658 RepID=A0A915HYC3_ROMCU